MSNLIEHARRELQAVGMFDHDSDYEGMLGDAVMELVSVFSKQEHSGFSASMCINLFKTVASYEPLAPLTGSADEWVDVSEVSEGTLWQNKRCSHVFKRGDGTAYDIQGKVFREPSGACYTNSDSHVDIEFPYTPTSEYVDVPEAD